MGLIIIATSIALSAFWIPGIWLSIRTVLGSDEPTKTLSLLLALVAAEGFLALVLPFIVNSGETIYQIGILLNSGTILGALSLVLGGGFWIYSWIKKRPVFSIVSASLFITTAVVPIFYFSISEKVATFFEVKWSY